MRLPRLQFKVRGLMILVAVVGLFSGAVIWAVRLARLSARYRETEAKYVQLENSLTRVIGSLESSLRSNKKLKLQDERVRMRNRSLQRRFPMPELDLSIDYDRWIEDDKRWIEQLTRQRQHATLLRQKYQRAASRPWERLPPDPPAPVEPAPSPPRRAPDPPVSPEPPELPLNHPSYRDRLTNAVPTSRSSCIERFSLGLRTREGLKQRIPPLRKCGSQSG